jgi:hypothetical protein
MYDFRRNRLERLACCATHPRPRDTMMDVSNLPPHWPVRPVAQRRLAAEWRKLADELDGTLKDG